MRSSTILKVVNSYRNEDVDKNIFFKKTIKNKALRKKL